MRNRIYIIFTVFICSVLVVSWLILMQLKSARKAYIEEQFESQIQSTIFTLRERFSRNKAMLNGIGAFFKGSDYVSYDEWNRYIDKLDLPETFPAITWVSYIKVVPSSQSQAFIQFMKEKENPNYSIWPQSNASLLFPIVYISPKLFGPFAGYDFSSTKVNNQILTKDLTSFEFTTLPPTHIKTEKTSKSKRILISPIRGEQGKTTGWISANIDFATIIQQTEEGILRHDLDLTVYIGKETKVKNIIYQKQTTETIDNPLTLTESFEFAGTTWTFVFKSAVLKQSLLSAYGFYLVLILLLLALTFGLMVYFIYAKKSGVFDKQCELEKSIMTYTQYAIIGTDPNGMITFFNPAAEKLLGYSAKEMIGQKTPESFHDKEEMDLRAKELSNLLNREVKSNFEVFVAFAEKDIPDNRKWNYIRKDQSKIVVQLSVSALRNEVHDLIGYVGFAIEAAQLKN